MNDESYIKLTIELAKKGKGKVSPNPLVGAVFVKNDKIIGAGYHKKCGDHHAEINAVKNSKESLENSTLYVNLEPCAHFGKTPPCVDELIKQKIGKVVAGTLDPNPLTKGKGIRKLRAAGIEVKVGILDKECKELNKFFFEHVTNKKPFVTLKLAQTLDGKIADKNSNSNWISCVESRSYVHKLRSEYDAVMVGTNTVKIDDPLLTVRLVKGRNPKRVIIDSDLSLSMKHKIFKKNNDGNLIVLTSKHVKSKENKLSRLYDIGAKVIFVQEKEDGTLNLKNGFKKLAGEDITSVLVEGGRKIFTTLLKSKLYDDILLFISPKVIGKGISSVSDLGITSIKRALGLQIHKFEKIGEDLALTLVKR